MHKSNRVNLNLGSSSLLLIFVLLSLVSFAVLSLSSALSDREISDKNLSRNIAYYNACNTAQDKLQIIDDVLFNAYTSSEDETSYLQACSKANFADDISISTVDSSISYLTPVDDYQGLLVVVKPVYPVADGDALYSITSWKLVYMSEPEIDFSINVIK